MKTPFPAIIVVEGATDRALIETFLDCDIVTTNGSDVPHETIEYLKEAKKKRDIVVLTDPDMPGKRIRDVLNQHIPGLLHAYIPKDKAIKHHKVGVAESDRDTILEALNNLVPAGEANRGNLTYADLMELGLVGSGDCATRREALCNKMHLGRANGKTLLKRLNALEIKKEELEAMVHE